LNEELLCDRVPFFKGAFKSGWEEGKSKVMELPEDDPEAFGLLVDWVYKEQLKCKICPPPIFGRSAFPKKVDAAHELQWLRLWVLADKFNLTGLGEAALSKHVGCLSDSTLAIAPETVALACEHSTEDSALRKHLVKMIVGAVFSTPPPPDTGSNGLGLAAAANVSFNQQVMDAIQQHMQIPRGNGCAFYFCTFHDSQSRGWGIPVSANSR
jgi:hypothetical protein